MRGNDRRKGQYTGIVYEPGLQMNIIRSHMVPEGVAGIRFSDYAKDVFADFLSHKKVKQAIKQGDLRIDGEVSPTGRWMVSGMRIDLIETRVPASRPYRRALVVVYEDAHLAVIIKPPGMAVNGNRFKTVEHALPGNLAPSGEEDALARPRPVHRLDASTGGLLLAAKTARAMVHLGRQFETRAVAKRYRAAVSGKLEGAGVIDRPIEEREALTDYAAVRHVPSLRNGFITLLDLWPRTGRTHQLRIHLAGLGHPIMGDGLYGPPGNVLRGKGLFLCAVEISFVHPVDGRALTFSIEDPPKFGALLQREKRRWDAYHSGV
jgi:RluA family pseudouridine synthase